MTTLEINLPDSLAKEAREAGLLTRAQGCLLNSPTS